MSRFFDQRLPMNSQKNRCTYTQFIWYGFCLLWMSGCLPFILPFEFQDVNVPPTIAFAAPDDSQPLSVNALGLQMFVVVEDPNDLSQVEFFWWVESANGSLNTPLESAIPVPNGDNTEMLSKITISQEQLVPYDGGQVGLRVRDSYGEEVSIRWNLTIQEASL